MWVSVFQWIWIMSMATVTFFPSPSGVLTSTLHYSCCLQVLYTSQSLRRNDNDIKKKKNITSCLHTLGCTRNDNCLKCSCHRLLSPWWAHHRVWNSQQWASRSCLVGILLFACCGFPYAHQQPAPVQEAAQDGDGADNKKDI